MRYLLPGLESKKKIELLLTLTKTGASIQGGLIDHFVNNFTVSQAALINGVKPNNLSVAVDNLNSIAETMEKLFELKTYDFSHTDN